VLGTALFGWGFARLSGQRVRPELPQIVLPAMAVALPVAQWLGDKPFAVTLDLMCLAVALSIVFVHRDLVLRPTHLARFALGISLVFYAATWLVRLGGSWQHEGPPLAHLLYVPEPWSTHFAIFYGVIPIIIASLVLNLLNADLNERLHARALTDELTGLMTRRGLLELAPSRQAKSLREGQSVALLMLDIDHFKRINDQHGHAAGDEVLRHAAKLIGKMVRGDALVTRYGGEEFVVLLTVSELQAAMRVAERVRSAVASARCRSHGTLLPLTVSIGVTIWADGEPLAAALQRADEALYRAKAAGRNQVDAAEAVPASMHDIRRAVGR
jgi:diguanylate cyclase (GGDEF)-like protein